MQAAAYRPFEGRRRVFILDDADAMSAAVQNAWLKTLEEPPSTSHFVLVDRASRSAAADGAIALPDPALRPAAGGRGGAAARSSATGMSQPDAREAAFASDGSLGRALVEASDAGTRDARAGRGRGRWRDRARGPRSSGCVSRRGCSSRPRRRRGRGARAASRSAPERELLGERLDVLGAALRDLSVAASGGDDRFMAHAPSADTLALAAPLGRGAADRRRLPRSDKARQALDRNASPKVVADWLAMQL